MAAAENGSVCEFCRGHVTWRLDDIAFRQSSDKGYVRCEVRLSVATCDDCGSKTLEADSDRIFEAAFQRAYRKLP